MERDVYGARIFVRGITRLIYGAIPFFNRVRASRIVKSQIRAQEAAGSQRPGPESARRLLFYVSL